MDKRMEKIYELSRLEKYQKVNPRRFLYLGIPRVLENPFYPRLEPKGKSIIDCGCGTGDDVRQFIKDRYNKVVGIDKDFIHLCLGFDYYQDRETLGHHFEVRDVLNLRFSDKFFDYSHSGSLTHTLGSEANIQRYFGEVYGVLKNGGIFIGRIVGSERENDKTECYLLKEKEVIQFLKNARFVDLETEKRCFDIEEERRKVDELNKVLPNRYELKESELGEYRIFFYAKKPD